MKRTTLSTLALAALAAVALFSTTPGTAEAQQRRSGPLFVSAGVGPFVYFDWDSAFRLEGEFGWHPGGQDEGFFIAADFTLTLDRHLAMVFGGARFGGDIEVFENRDVAVLLTPSGLAGFGWLDHGAGRGGFYSGGFGYFVIQPAFQVDVALLERVLWVWARPVGFDFLMFPDTWRDDGTRGFRFDWGYQFMAGARFNFG